jgi:hypothetical protein
MADQVREHENGQLDPLRRGAVQCAERGQGTTRQAQSEGEHHETLRLVPPRAVGPRTPKVSLRFAAVFATAATSRAIRVRATSWSSDSFGQAFVRTR